MKRSGKQLNDFIKHDSYDENLTYAAMEQSVSIHKNPVTGEISQNNQMVYALIAQPLCALSQRHTYAVG